MRSVVSFGMDMCSPEVTGGLHFDADFDSEVMFLEGSTVYADSGSEVMVTF